MTRHLPAPHADRSASVPIAPINALAAMRRLLRAGLVTVFLLVGVVGGWAFATEISGAVLAPGSIVVTSNVKKVQHPTGGIVGEIRARDGDHVRVGDVVIRLDETVTRANLAIVTKSLNELTARKARLLAERDQVVQIRYPSELIALAATDPEVAYLVASESKVFQLRLAARSGQKSVLGERKHQLGDEILGHQAQAASKEKEIAFIHRELEGAKALWQKNLMPITKLTQLEREATRLTGERAQLLASVAQARGRISEIAMQVLQIDRDASSEVSRELREIEGKIGELTERKIAAEDQMRRIDIRAPQDGIVHQSAVHTIGGVVSPGEVLMLIVPDTDTLAVEARVAPQDVDQLWLGQQAMLRFSAFNQRTTPEISGTVERISADVTREERNGQTFYTVRIIPAPGEVARLGTVKLVPGMPVEAMIKTSDRKVISYLVKPLQDQIARAFREN
ncbi:MAG: HlyD family type I secretion periplasmic adaptor subunit [Hyphomicrobiaceae bacterium]